MSTILVTGAAGFIGSHVVDKLIEERHEVIAFDNLATGKKEYVSEEAHFEEGDIRNVQDLERVFKKYSIDYIVHEAAIINTNVLKEEAVNDVEVSVLGTVNLIDCCWKYKVKRLVFASSVAVYGVPDEEELPISEEGELKPIYSYGIAKKCAEEYLEYYASTREISYGVVRYVNIFGPRQPIYGEVGVIAIFSNYIVKNKPLTIFGDGEQKRDFLFVSDAVDATIKMIWCEDNLTVNVGSGRGTTVNEVFSGFEKAIGGKIFCQKKPLRFGEIGKFYCSNKLAKDKLNWIPKISLDEGLKRTLEFEKLKKD
jgi:UDP-glucose 4-epimerase